MLSGGSTASTSLIWFATTFTAQVVPAGRSTVGSSVICEPPEPVTPYACGEPLGHSMVNELPPAFTASLNVITMLLLGFTAVAPFAGVVVDTVGALSVVNEKL